MSIGLKQKNKQKMATRHTGNLECGTQQALVLTNVGPLSTTLLRISQILFQRLVFAVYNEGRCDNMVILHAGPLATTLDQD